MDDNRLSAHCLFNAESEVFRKIQFDDVIRDFVNAKSRKQQFLQKT